MNCRSPWELDTRFCSCLSLRFLPCPLHASSLGTTPLVWAWVCTCLSPATPTQRRAYMGFYPNSNTYAREGSHYCRGVFRPTWPFILRLMDMYDVFVVDLCIFWYSRRKQQRCSSQRESPSSHLLPCVPHCHLPQIP